MKKGNPVTTIDLSASEMSHWDASSLLNQLFTMYLGRVPNDSERNRYIPILQENGFTGTAYVLDALINSDEMKALARQEVEQLWQEHLRYTPTPTERDRYEKRLRFFRDKEKNRIIETVNRAEELRKQAAPLLESGDWVTARRLLDKAVADGLANWHVWHDHGLVRFRQEDFEAAIPSYQKAIALNTDDSYPWSCADLKWCYGNLAEDDPKWYEEGLHYFKSVTQDHPDRWIAYHECGWMLLKVGRYEEAISYYQQAIDKLSDPTWGWSYLDLLDCYTALNRRNQAYDYFASLAKQGSLNWGVWHSLGNLEWKYANEPELALKAYRKSTSLRPEGGWFQTWIEIGWCSGDLQNQYPQKYHQGFEAFEQAKKIDANQWQVWQGLGWAKEKLEEWEAAIVYFQKSLEFNPNYAWSYVGLGRCYRKRKKYINSWEAYQKALNTAPDPSDERAETIRGLDKIKDDIGPALRKLLNKSFNLEEIRVLCFDLSITYDNLAGETLQMRTVSLIEYCQRQNRLADLIQAVRDQRPHLIPLTIPGSTDKK